MEFLSYGHSTWAEFLAAYTAKRVVYCRASSNSNPASGSQTRLAFMAYVNNAENPTEVEFQYYRSVSSHTVSQQGDQVYVYKLNKTNGWSVIVREASVKVAAGTDIDLNYKNGVATLSFSGTIPSTAADVGAIAAPEQPAEGDLLIWDGTTWAPDELTASSIGAIEAPSTPTTGASLIYNGTDWVAQQLTASDVGALPNTATISVSSVNGQTGIVNLTASDVGALPANTTFPVSSVNGQTGTVVLTASDVGALPSNTTFPVSSVNGQTGTIELEASDIGAVAMPDSPTTGDSLVWDGTDWTATQLTASDVGALPANTTFPVSSVNGQTGAVTLAASDVGALPDDTVFPVNSVNGQTGTVVLTALDVGALPNTTVIPVSSVNGQTGAVVLNAANVGAIAAPSSPANGAFLVWNGTAWIAQTLASWQGGNY